MDKHCTTYLLLIVLQLSFLSSYALKTLYIDQLCPPFSSKTIIHDFSEASAENTSIVLKTSHFSGYPGHINCTIIFKSPPFGGIIVSSREINIRETDTVVIEYENGVSVNVTSLESIWFSKHFSYDMLTLYFMTGIFPAKSNHNATFFFTSFSRNRTELYDLLCTTGDYEYIWSGFKCDGYIHCRDASDQFHCDRTTMTTITTTTTTVPVIKTCHDHYREWRETACIIAGCIVVICILIIVIDMLIFMKKRQNTSGGSVMPPSQPIEAKYKVPTMYPQVSFPLITETLYPPPPPPYTPQVEK